MMKRQEESNESWEKERKRKKMEDEKRFIPDHQWKLIVGGIGFGLIIFIVYYTMQIFTFILMGNDDE